MKSNHPIISKEEIDKLFDYNQVVEIKSALNNVLYSRNKLGNFLEEYVQRTMLAER